jgi:hypothetical protein
MFIKCANICIIGFPILDNLYKGGERMKCKDCKIVCNGKEVATIKCDENGFSIKCTEEGKEMCKELGKGCC